MIQFTLLGLGFAVAIAIAGMDRETMQITDVFATENVPALAIFTVTHYVLFNLLFFSCNLSRSVIRAWIQDDQSTPGF